MCCMNDNDLVGLHKTLDEDRSTLINLQSGRLPLRVDSGLLQCSSEWLLTAAYRTLIS